MTAMNCKRIEFQWLSQSVQPALIWTNLVGRLRLFDSVLWHDMTLTSRGYLYRLYPLPRTYPTSNHNKTAHWAPVSLNEANIFIIYLYILFIYLFIYDIWYMQFNIYILIIKIMHFARIFFAASKSPRTSGLRQWFLRNHRANYWKIKIDPGNTSCCYWWFFCHDASALHVRLCCRSSVWCAWPSWLYSGWSTRRSPSLLCHFSWHTPSMQIVDDCRYIWWWDSHLNLCPHTQSAVKMAQTIPLPHRWASAPIAILADHIGTFYHTTSVRSATLRQPPWRAFCERLVASLAL